MASDINRVSTGRKTNKRRRAEVYKSGGMAIADISLASTRSRKQGDQWVEEANFFDVSLCLVEERKPFLNISPKVHRLQLKASSGRTAGSRMV